VRIAELEGRGWSDKADQQAGDGDHDQWLEQAEPGVA
jgi:hypothetical protein